MRVFTKRWPPDRDRVVTLSLWLSAEERQRSRYQFETETGETVRIHLPRGTVLQDGDLLGEDPTAVQGTAPAIARVRAKPEPVLTVTAERPFDLLRAAYHLGNRHVPLEICPDCLRLAPDSVLADMVLHMGLQVREETLPFFPEAGAYATGHSPDRGHHHT